MGVRTRRAKSPKQNGTSLSISTPGDEANGHANGNGNGKMSNIEYRRKGAAQHDSDTVTANLMARDSFSLDDAVPKTPTVNNHGFWDLPIHDQRNFGLLVLLYFLQGVPLGLATGSVPFLLKNHMSYGEIGVFSLASYPYSLKLLWSPIVDAIWSPKVGRRKSWILPIQFLSGIGMLYLGSVVEGMMAAVGKPGGPTVWNFTGWWFFLVLMCATQDIAVDGWALTLLTPGNISYASTAQTVGLTAGQFLSYTIFLAFNSKDFANRYFRTEPLDYGLISLGGYLTFAGWAYIVVTIGLAIMKREEKTRNEDGIWDVYKIMWGVLKLKNIQTIIIVHLIAKIGFQANDGVTNLKLLDKGFGTDNMALTVLIDFPFEMSLGYYAGKWSQQYTPMRLWCWGFAGRLVAALFAQFTVIIFPAEGVTPWYLVVVILEHIFSTFMNTVMFVAVAAFHARIADPVIGGTYMTLLATVSNLGGTFPRFFVLKMVDAFTAATCHPGKPDPAKELTAPLVTEAFSCAIQADKERCINGGGTCETIRDGYYTVNIICVLIGVVTFLMFIKPKVLQLQSLPLRAWRLSGAK
ncbi:putative acetyl-coenzyme a transporter 1 protein [Phaeoacremonium minimum UCRPA7]|uniref:Putative acetyl-coenzyme a transporter 1 protein n=1 Tax=Phaeoacremonium minimum (strain UCR-PA7) TaxID=1286976 RepID=R8BII7_PHAM7|nr:putative acetyl-coenzyme a transporter 1 protein [Phaeoacremonium minimum UCRPA7]EON99094.1 putative acetyl-coenzyme a transporter 1 protein [Phaeoacremonium minimum UCRPA7]